MPLFLINIPKLKFITCQLMFSRLTLLTSHVSLFSRTKSSVCLTMHVYWKSKTKSRKLVSATQLTTFHPLLVHVSFHIFIFPTSVFPVPSLMFRSLPLKLHLHYLLCTNMYTWTDARKIIAGRIIDAASINWTFHLFTMFVAPLNTESSCLTLNPALTCRRENTDRFPLWNLCTISRHK